MPSVGIVRTWNVEAGWGVIDSADTPGGCWIHISTPSTVQHRGLDAGRSVYFEWERLPGTGIQDGYHYVATDAWYVGDEPFRRPKKAHPPGAYRTSLTITYDDGTVVTDDDTST
ncbi:cold shock domain-containing protein [Hoyosella altamirensis]|uniref:CspA family cold shock protein n=1 Tax=Hoyosella altamirensis TaxID=616997 RepID=A0A839RKE4_9ACTN|nr:cold shock domain-containing protein [Hoyosella altamirensis]MBB3036930.1 CspA family cold shock protein [Hoyosella altamirensis]